MDQAQTYHKTRVTDEALTYHENVFPRVIKQLASFHKLAKTIRPSQKLRTHLVTLAK